MKPSLPTLSLSALAFAVAAVALTPADVRAATMCAENNWCLTSNTYNSGSCVSVILPPYPIQCGCNASGTVFPAISAMCSQ